MASEYPYTHGFLFAGLPVSRFFRDKVHACPLRRLFEQSRVPAVEQTSARGVSRLAGPAVTMANGGDQWAKQAAKALFGGEITRTTPPHLTDHAPKPARLSSVVVFS